MTPASESPFDVGVFCATGHRFDLGRLAALALVMFSAERTVRATCCWPR